MPGVFIRRPDTPKQYECTDKLKNCFAAANWTKQEKVTSRCCGFCASECNNVNYSCCENIHFLACELQTECPEHSVCIENGDDFTCNCKRGFFEDEGSCIGKIVILMSNCYILFQT